MKIFAERLSRKVPLKTPAKSDKITSFVIKAKAIATKGGISVKAPNKLAFAAASEEFANATKGKNNKTKNLFIHLFLYKIHSKFVLPA